ncbi:MAG TPA: alpha/beta fold hydrolase [Rhodospirillaceae bacterium]|nr:alpha/beta fold hydrolase [Rhodospirillaceae bacterium]
MTRRTIAVTVIAIPVLVIALLAAMIVFGTAAPPRVTAPSVQSDPGALPPLETLPARDGTPLAYRAYPAAGNRLAILVHGSAGTSMHAVAKALQAAGVGSYALDVRGHGGTGTAGDIAYVGQLDDDLADFASQIRRRHPAAKVALAGFSSGGGFVLRVAGSANGGLFDSYALISPYLGHRAPTQRPDAAEWITPFVPRLIALAVLERIGVHAFEGLPVVALAMVPGKDGAANATYSYRLAKNFTPSEDYRGDFRRATKPIAVVVGGADEVFFADRFAPEIHAVRPDITVLVVPGLGHFDMTTTAAGALAVSEAIVQGLAL